MIVVTTPTGTIGRQVVDRVLDAGEAVRVVVRDSSRLPPHVQARAEVVQGSHGDADTITKALRSADRLFWLVPPADFRDADRAEHHYREFTRPACQEAARQGLRVVGVTSLGHGYRGEAGLLSAALAMDELFEDAGAHYRALALPFFMENLLHHIPAMTEQGTFSMANAADRPLATVATRDVADAAAALLLDTSWSGQARVPLAGPDRLTPHAMAEVVSDVLGRTIRYRQIPLAELKTTMIQRGASPALAQDMAEMVEAQNDGIYDAEPRGPESVAATGFRQWCRDHLVPAAQS
ncbi:NmrA family NAD(P)-binding protein [Streptomyces mangrovisoli]|uniref:NmrA family transcriptional regulator n=1 Tax=Streptomyces mangrovisoli TaxID=1428628 RepID=A0A1J4P4E3_9ACTN|nr:NmrA family NAD(P)-binding protein [Streptomyces mangrovisoli]OIJ68333.1 NmrA family transcriptional regulator [Streptomyces mangrovisoli]